MLSAHPPTHPPLVNKHRSARDPAFLEALSSLQPDLCVTAAYGNMLPPAFLAIPRHGTLNVHPSLLPLYRGAAPVQRALQVGRMVCACVRHALSAAAMLGHVWYTPCHPKHATP